MNSAVLSLLPNAGLGNKLFVWARAVAFSHLNRLDCYCLGWTIPRIGPILRGERRDIRYGKYLQSDAMHELQGAFRLLLNNRVFEPPIAECEMDKRDIIFVFNKLPPWNEFFVSLHAHRQIIIERFAGLPRIRIQNAVQREKRPIVSVHIRRGDFRELRDGEAFEKVGGVRTPLDYFVEIIRNIRKCSGWSVPISVFSDGTDDELQSILMVENVSRAPALPDVAHLMLMARSDVIVTSAGSTFSMWAGFLSDASIILHPDHIHAPIRPLELQDTLYEGPATGPWAGWNPKLISKVQSIGTAN